MAWNLTNTVIAVLALVVSAIAAYYARKQVLLIRAELQRERREEESNADWAARANEVIPRLVALVPLWSNGSSGVANGWTYTMIFDDSDFRALVEAYLILRNGERAAPRQLTPDLLQMPAVRETIRRVEERFAHIRQNSPALAAKARLAGGA